MILFVCDQTSYRCTLVIFVNLNTENIHSLSNPVIKPFKNSKELTMNMPSDSSTNFSDVQPSAFKRFL